MLNDILWPDRIQWQRTPYWSDFVPKSTFYRNLSGFHDRTFATGVACRQGTLTTPDIWFRPLCGGLHVLWLLRPVSPTLHRFNDLPKLTFIELICFHRAFATGVACQQGALTPPNTWSRPFGTCICSTCWDQSFSELVVILPDYAVRISLLSILLSGLLQT